MGAVVTGATVVAGFPILALRRSMGLGLRNIVLQLCGYTGHGEASRREAEKPHEKQRDYLAEALVHECEV